MFRHSFTDGVVRASRIRGPRFADFVRSFGRTTFHADEEESPSSSNVDLESFNVKKLRQLVKQSPQCEYGLLSRLKTKQDLVEFLGKSDGVKSSTHTDQNPAENPATPSSDTSNVHQQESVNHADEQNMSIQDQFIQKARERYQLPASPSEDALPSETGKHDDEETKKLMDDIRQQHHPMLRGIGSRQSEIMLVCLGTGSGRPSRTRGSTSTALKLALTHDVTMWDRDQKKLHTRPIQRGTWIFDAGEGTQTQLMNASQVKAKDITKIFITHAHGDHSFGLASLLCLLGVSRDLESPPIDIYGPEGLRMFLRSMLTYSVSRAASRYRVHEIMQIPMAPEWEVDRRTGKFFHTIGRPTNPLYQRRHWGDLGLAGEDRRSWITNEKHMKLIPTGDMFGEVPGGRDIFPIYSHPLSSYGAPVWEILEEGDLRVYAAPTSHTIPTLGYVVEEKTRVGRLRNELIEPIIRQNGDALCKERNLKSPMIAMKIIKKLPPGGSFTFPDGTVITHEEALEPAKEGRKIVMCGDSCDSRALTKLAQNADVLVHEATTCFFPDEHPTEGDECDYGEDVETFIANDGYKDKESFTRNVISRGHSTAQMAGLFAKQVHAKRLILNHISPQFWGNPATESLATMMRIEDVAMQASGLDETQVIAAWDGATLPVLDAPPPPQPQQQQQ